MADTDTIDYLGGPAPVSLEGKPALPVVGAPMGTSSGPSAPSGGGSPPPTGVGAPMIPTTGTPTGATAAGTSSSGLPWSQVLSWLQLGGKLTDFAKLFGGGGSPLGLTEGEAAAQGGQGGVATGIDESVNIGLGAEGLGEASAQGGLGGVAAGVDEAVNAGLSGPSALSGAFGVLGTAAPIWAGLTALVDFLGEGKFPLEGPLNAIFGFDNPSKEWLSFGGRLGDTFKGYETANSTLAQALAGATTPEQIKAAVEAWRGSTKTSGEGLEIGDLPGGTGTPHEGKQFADFSPEVLGLRAELDAAMKGASPQDRISALLAAAQKRRDTLGAESQARQATQDAMMADADKASMLAGTGSA